MGKNQHKTPFAVKYPLSQEQWENIAYEFRDSKARELGVTFRSYVKRHYDRFVQA